jgi:hypothetical protein
MGRSAASTSQMGRCHSAEVSALCGWPLGFGACSVLSATLGAFGRPFAPSRRQDATTARFARNLVNVASMARSLLRRRATKGGGRPLLSTRRRYRSQAASARPIMASSSLRQADPEAGSTMAMILPHRAYAREVRGQGDQLARGAPGTAPYRRSTLRRITRLTDRLSWTRWRNHYCWEGGLRLALHLTGSCELPKLVRSRVAQALG